MTLNMTFTLLAEEMALHCKMYDRVYISWDYLPCTLVSLMHILLFSFHDHICAIGTVLSRWCARASKVVLYQ